MQNGEKLKHLRMMKGYSQNGIAKKLGFTQQAYSKIESEQIKIDDVRMKEILKILQCSPDDLREIEKFFTATKKQIKKSGPIIFTVVLKTQSNKFSSLLSSSSC